MKRYIIQLLAYLMLANPLMLTAMELQPDQIEKGKEEADEAAECAFCMKDLQDFQRVRLKCSNTLCVACLEKVKTAGMCHWCTQAWSDDHIAPVAAEDKPAPDCGICIMEAENPLPLGCRHVFCAACLHQQLELGLKEFQNLQKNLKCPVAECPYIMQDADILLVAGGDDEYVHRFHFALTKLAMDKDNKIKYCPIQNCGAPFELERPDKQIVACTVCHNKFCSECSFSHEMRSPCGRSEADSQNIRNQENENQFREWARLNTKPCPNRNCRKLIEKNDGCNHMTCRRDAGGCGHEFCWVCLVPWREARHGYYECNRDPAQVNWNNQPNNLPAANNNNNDEEERVHRAMLGLLGRGLAAQQPNWQQNFQDDMADDQELRRRGLLQEEDVINNPRHMPYPHAQFQHGPPSNRPPYLLFVVIGAAATAAVSYGAYKLYKYLTVPKPSQEPDLKTSLETLHKEAIKARTRLTGPQGYAAGSFKDAFAAQERNNVFKALDAKQMNQLRKIVDDLEKALVAGHCDKQYAALVKFVNEQIALAQTPTDHAPQKLAMKPREVLVRQTPAAQKTGAHVKQPARAGGAVKRS